jgi:hypothetical protein
LAHWTVPPSAPPSDAPGRTQPASVSAELLRTELEEAVSLELEEDGLVSVAVELVEDGVVSVEELLGVVSLEDEEEAGVEVELFGADDIEDVKLEADTEVDEAEGLDALVVELEPGPVVPEPDELPEEAVEPIVPVAVLEEGLPASGQRHAP